MRLNNAQLATLRAVLDRIIPRDDFPSATEAGVDNYVTRQLERDLAAEFPAIAGGLDAIAAEASTRRQSLAFTESRAKESAFERLPEAQQDALLDDISHRVVKTPWPPALDPAQFFARLVELAAEGFYADPGQGGNVGEVSWKMIGYARRVPEKPSAP